MPNRLANATSPYLQQHADNPVDWMEWGEEAFERARREDKPIFLSIGYSTCHWCHVMAHESFENEAIARLLNAHFVPVKVDREERPDVDRVYMTYVQALTGHGGWPLSAWLTPELKPFYGGTYFPPEDRHGRHGFASVLRVLAQGWEKDRAKLVEESHRVIGALGDYLAGERDGEETAKPETSDLVDAAGQAFEKCFQYLYESFDQQQGGFGGAPKFPRASNLDFLYRCAVLQGTTSEAGRDAITMAATTLQRMTEGGIHDHVGGGFHRYAVDEAWFVPHFEKMLYDQAQIAINLVDAYSFTGDQRFAWTARDVFDYVLRDLTHAGGGFFAAEDADSEPEAGQQTENGGHKRKLEGAFYLWTRDQLEQVLGEDAEWFCDHYGVTAEGNVPGSLDPHGEMRGGNILKQQRPLMETAKRHRQDVIALADKLAFNLDKLRAVRALRPRPHRDEKIITAWNGLMLSALARASICPAECLDDKRPFYAAAAVRCADFVEKELYDAHTGVLYRSWRDGRGNTEGFAEDYAAWIGGLLDLYESHHDVRWLTWAERLQRSLDERFWDEEQGGYFQSRAGDASIVLRIKDDHDGAEPSANSMAAANLARLGNLLHDRALLERAERTLQAFQSQWLRVPQALPAMLCALEWVVQPARQLVLAGEPESAAMTALKAEAIARPGRRRTLVVLTGAPSEAWLVERSPVLKAMTERMSEPRAYLCEGETCQAPVSTPADLRALLEG